MRNRLKSLGQFKKDQIQVPVESLQIQRRRSVPVPDRIEVFYVCRPVIAETEKIIDEHARKVAEALVFWAGGVADGRAYVTTCFYPRKSVTRYGGVKVALAQMTKINLALAERDQIILCQVHSHPGLALQSDVDERRAVTFHRGFISIVVPDFDGRKLNRLGDCGVYEYSNGKWRALGSREIRQRFIVEESLVEV